MASKIERKLTPAEVVEMLDTLVKTEGGVVLRVIQEEAKKRGLDISPMSARSFRDAKLKPYLERLALIKEKSKALAEMMTDGDEAGLLATARVNLAEKVSDYLMDEEIESKEYPSLAKTLTMLSSANQGDAVTRARLREFEAKEEERKAEAAKLEERKRALVNKGGLSEEAITLMEETLKILS